MERIAKLLGVKLYEHFHLYDNVNENPIEGEHFLAERGIYKKAEHSDIFVNNMLEMIFRRDVKIVKKTIELSHAERVILENINKKYKWIARDGNEMLWLFWNNPQKNKHSGVWVGGEEFTPLEIYNHLFKFISWEDKEPYCISELLKESEEVNDED